MLQMIIYQSGKCIGRKAVAIPNVISTTFGEINPLGVATKVPMLITITGTVLVQTVYS